jgi:hypothetical protein
MNLLDGLLSGAQGDEHRDFLRRYQEGGDPTSGFSLPEALQRFGQIVPNLSPDQFQHAAQQSFNNMSPQLRDQFGQILQQQAQQHGLNLPDLLGAGQQQLQNPNFLAGVTSNMHQNGMLNQILAGALSGAMGGFSHGGVQGALGGAQSGALGAAGGGALGGVLGGMAGNVAENAAGNLGPFGSPAIKAAIGGIAANAVQSILHSHGL